MALRWGCARCRYDRAPHPGLPAIGRLQRHPRMNALSGPPRLRLYSREGVSVLERRQETFTEQALRFSTRHPNV